jgi:hypothetical protein
MKYRYGEDIEIFLCEEELPPEDGMYFITNNLKKDDINTLLPYSDSMVAEYNGYGFKFEERYIEPLYWGKLPPICKKYGKLNAHKPKTE